MTEPSWQWCAQPGAARSTQLRVEQTDYGDGYVHRLTRGLNPTLPKWSLQFPFVDLATLNAMDAFLAANGAAGFYFLPPDETAERFVYCDTWAATIVDRTGAGAKVGNLSAEFVRCYNPQPSLLPPPDLDVWSWAQAVASAGGSVSGARLDLVSTFVKAEKAAGCWALTDDYWFLCGENAVQARMSLKQRRLASAVNSPVFVANRGYTFDGLTSYLNSGFIVTSHTTTMTLGNMRIGIYERPPATALNATSFGVSHSTGNNLTMRAKANTAMVASACSSGGNYTVTDNLGLSTSSRAGGATTMQGYRNGVRQPDSAGLTVGNTVMPTLPLFIGCLNNVGTAAGFRPAATSFAVVGAPFNDTQEADHYAHVQALHTAIGAQA